MTARTLLLASANKGKLVELRELLPTIHLVSLADVGIDDLDEPADDYVTNAVAKAREASLRSGLPALADDSGLAVDALSGAPGAFSARFGGTHGDNARNRATLLARLDGVPDALRGARFRCVVALADVRGPLGDRVPWRHADCAGSIAREARGGGGFGYDPLFVPAGDARTMAELPHDEKNARSHRGRAIRAMLPLLTRYLAACADVATRPLAALPSEP